MIILGGGLFFAALTTLAMSAATASDSGLVNTTQQVGGAVGGYHLAWGISVGLAVAGILLAVVLLRPETAPQEEGAGPALRACPLHLTRPRTR